MPASTIKKVAVIGATGRVGREAIQQLASRKIPVRCLLRHDLDGKVKPRIDKDASSAEVAAYLATLSGVEMVKGDVTNPESVRELLQGCDAVLAVQGPPVPKNKLLPLFPFLNTETASTHPKMINYVGVENILEAAKASPTCKRIVRITGKGESPWSFFSILINMLGNMAKAWNYEGEQLLRNCPDVDYTIIRPGIMGREDCPTGAVLALADNGADLKVSAVPHETIAKLCIECLDYPNAARSTLTAMNVPPGEGEESYAPLLAKVKPDSREFPYSLLEEHKRATRTGAGILLAVVAVTTSGVLSVGKAGVRALLSK